MIVLGGVVAGCGLVLLHLALGMTLRANSASRVPFYRNADRVSKGSVATRAAGAGLTVVGILLLGTVAWYWPFIIVLAGPVVGLVAISIHNNRVAGAES